MADRVDTVVVGAGVVGLAVARRLAMAGCEVVVLEAADGIGTETSSRNSEVIHAGIYYPTGSLKARLCVAGKHALYDYCASHGVPHRRCGKLIAATDEAQAEQLAALQKKAADNGVGDLAWVDRAQAAELEPAVRCVVGLLSPSTGIIDSHALMLAMQGDAEDHGAMIAFRTPVRRGAVTDDGILIEAGDGGETTALLAARMVNSAGLGAQALAQSIAGMPSENVPPRHLARGVYFTLSGRNPFSHLVYPVPEPGGLGVHVTFDMGGQVRFGPDVEWIDEVDYTVDPARAERFYPAIRRYFPALADGALQPGYAGIRPKVVPQGAPAGDFIVQGPDDHGIAGLVNLYGIESPGLTASLAVADMVADKLGVG
jgi:L-2-hydroxyglutarate oxidase LhgO